MRDFDQIPSTNQEGVWVLTFITDKHGSRHVTGMLTLLENKRIILFRKKEGHEVLNHSTEYTGLEASSSFEKKNWQFEPVKLLEALVKSQRMILTSIAKMFMFSFIQLYL